MCLPAYIIIPVNERKDAAHSLIEPIGDHFVWYKKPEVSPSTCLEKRVVKYPNRYTPHRVDSTKLTAEPRENHEQWETPVDKLAQSEKYRAARQAIPPNV